VPGIQRDKSAGLIRPTTATQLSSWASDLTDVTPTQIRDWLRDVGLPASKGRRQVLVPGADYDPDDRRRYLANATHQLDTTDPSQVRKLMQVLEECLMASARPSAAADLERALQLDGYTVDDAGNIVDPATAELFAVGLDGLEDASAITQQIGRIQKNLHVSPEEAIDATAALVAAALKLVLASHGQAVDNTDLPKLAAQARPFIEGHYRAIGLDGDPTKQIFSGIVTVVNGIARIRNDASPTHPGLKAKTAHAEAAELLVSAAAPIVRACLASLGHGSANQ